jgi:hypothetical protein
MDNLLGRGNFCPTGNRLRDCTYACPTYNMCPPNTEIEECPYHSAFGGEYGCDAVTCGWAYTCNG